MDRIVFNGRIRPTDRSFHIPGYLELATPLQQLQYYKLMANVKIQSKVKKIFQIFTVILSLL
jgi:hypothetical protein